MRFALLGHPVSHSISPAIQKAAFAARGLSHTYDALDAPTEGDLLRAVTAIRRGDLGGANITVPHKRAVLAMVDEVAPSASGVGAANVLSRRDPAHLVAHNTDVEALFVELERALGDRPRGRAAVIGAGGAGLAAVVAAKRLGFLEIAVTTRSWSSPEALASSPSAQPILALGALVAPFPRSDSGADPPGFEASAPLRIDWLDWAAGADLILQATSAGMTGIGSGHVVVDVVPWERLKRSALLYDVVYNPLVTPLLQRASACGVEAVGGLGMLVRQAALSFELWTAIEAPLSVMRDAAVTAMRRLE